MITTDKYIKYICSELGINVIKINILDILRQLEQNYFKLMLFDIETKKQILPLALGA